MGVGAEANSGHPLLSMRPDGVWGLHLAWSNAPAGAPADAGWHASTAGLTQVPLSQVGGLLDAARSVLDGLAPATVIDAAMMQTDAAPVWVEAVTQADLSCGLPALYGATVRSLCRLML